MECPVHKTEMIYWPAGSDYACQNPDCIHAHGIRPHRPMTKEQVERVKKLSEDSWRKTDWQKLADEVNEAISKEGMCPVPGHNHVIDEVSGRCT